MSATKIRQCPFCGSRGILPSSDNGRYWVICASKTCNTQGPLRATEAGAIKAWNHRSNDDLPVAAVRKGDLVFTLPRPYRHHDVIRLTYLLTGEELKPVAGYEQGFFFNGRFITREKCFELTGKGRTGKTFTEDLW